MIVAELSFPVIYNYWAFMALDIYQLIIWLVAMAITATNISDINHAVNLINSYASGAGINSGSSSGSGSDCYDGYCFTSGKVKRQEGQDIPSYGIGDYGNYGKLDSISKAKTYRGIVGAIAGISGLEMCVLLLPFLGSFILIGTAQGPLWHYSRICCYGSPCPPQSWWTLHAPLWCYLTRAQGQPRCRATVRAHAPPTGSIPSSTTFAAARCQRDSLCSYAATATICQP
jgi:hypothetical protein